MKSIEEQIEFIDKKLVVIYGFINIIDYDKIIYVNEPENNNIDLIKLNEIIPEFRKVFQSKHFSLHKTNYKIENASQAICLLKKCLEITSIPFDISFHKNKKILRLISYNNVLGDYIKKLKTTDSRTFPQKSNMSENAGDKNHLLLKNTAIPMNIKVYPFTADYMNQQNQEEKIIDNKSYKSIVKNKKITKEILHKSIKKVMDYNISIDTRNIVSIGSINLQDINIDMSMYGLQDKAIQHMNITIKSKSTNNIPDESILKKMENIDYKLVLSVGNNNDIYNRNELLVYRDKFINGQDVILSDIIILMKYIKECKMILKLTNINSILDNLDDLYIELNIKHVTFNKELENKLKITTGPNTFHIEQPIVLKNNDILFGTYPGFSMVFPLVNNNLIKENIKKEKVIFDNLIKKDFTYEDISLYGFNGCKILNYNYNIYNQYINMDQKYDFIMWEDIVKVPFHLIPYSKITNREVIHPNGNKLFFHSYEIKINGDHYNSMSKFNITIPNLDKVINNIYSIEMSYNGYLEDFEISKTNNTFYLLIDENKHILTDIDKVDTIKIIIWTINDDNPIKEDIYVSGEFFSWNKEQMKKFQTFIYNKMTLTF